MSERRQLRRVGPVVLAAAALLVAGDVVGALAGKPLGFPYSPLGVVSLLIYVLVLWLAAAYWASLQLTIYPAGRSTFWGASPTFFAIRLGLTMALLPAMWALGRYMPSRLGAPLATLGAASLFAYWVHVELVYGYSSWLWRQRLPLWGTAIAYVLFCALLYRAIGWRDRFVDFWRARPRGALMSSPSRS